MNRKAILIGAMICLLLAGTIVAVTSGQAMSSEKKEGPEPSRLCVVWSSGDPGVAKNVCFMYTLNAKKVKWFDTVHLVVWGPSAKLLIESEDLQAEMKAMQKAGVKTEACLACAKRYGVDDDLRKMGIDVAYMGKPLSDRLKGDWLVIVF